MEIGALFAALVWWEFIILGVIGVALITSLANESAVITGIALTILLFVPWSGVGYLVPWTFTFWGFVSSVVVYLGLGILWSLWKWRELVLKTKQGLLEDVKRYPGTYVYSVEKVKERLENKKNNDTIGFWIGFWVLSATAYVFKFLFSDMIAVIVARLGNTYNKITDAALK